MPDQSSAAGGYALTDITPRSDWPGLGDGAGGGAGGGGGTVEFDPPAMRAVADWLQAQYRRVDVSALSAGAVTGGYGDSSWAQAMNLMAASDKVAVTVQQYADQVLTNLALASEAITASADRSAHSEDASQQLLTSIQGAVAQVGPYGATG
jgi:hypothetical protein